MMNTKVALKQLMATHFITVDVPCPECGGAMTAWKEPTQILQQDVLPYVWNVAIVQ